jgi:hypothetical protein
MRATPADPANNGNTLPRSISSYRKVPAILHACVESRSLALEAYELSFGMNDKPGCVYINFATDAVYINCKTFVSWGVGSGIDQVKGLDKVKAITACTACCNFLVVAGRLEVTPSLEALFLLMDDSQERFVSLKGDQLIVEAPEHLAEVDYWLPKRKEFEERTGVGYRCGHLVNYEDGKVVE